MSFLYYGSGSDEPPDDSLPPLLPPELSLPLLLPLLSPEDSLPPELDPPSPPDPDEPDPDEPDSELEPEDEPPSFSPDDEELLLLVRSSFYLDQLLQVFYNHPYNHLIHLPFLKCYEQLQLQK